jgi:hypothetical protein
MLDGLNVFLKVNEDNSNSPISCVISSNSGHNVVTFINPSYDVVIIAVYSFNYICVIFLECGYF